MTETSLAAPDAEPDITIPELAEGFIAARKADLTAAIRAEGGLAAETAAQLGDVFRVLGAVLHYEAHEGLESLRALYDPLDPDAPASRRDSTAAAFGAFESALQDALSRANFQEIETDTGAAARATRALTGLKIKASNAGIRRVRFFARGAAPQKIERRTWFGLRRVVIEAQVYNDVVVLVGFKGAGEIEKADRPAFAKMRRGVRPGAALVKHFRNVATAELVTLHPGARPSMQRHDQVLLAVPAIAGGVPILMQIGPALAVLAAIVAAYFGAGQVIDDQQMRRAVAALGGLVALGAFMMRQRLKYEAKTLKYQKQLSDTVYFRNIANNAGVLDLLVGAGEEQDAKEAYLAYWALLRAGKPLTRAEIDAAAESFLRDKLALSINFEIGDALAKLERLRLITREGETFTALPPAQALEQLDAAWDSYFKFAAAPA